jgi:benzylsuccinate CoA-transferase BbsF subunit
LGASLAEQGGNRQPGAAPAGCFRAEGADAWLAVSVVGETQWSGLCDALGQPELRDDPRFSRESARLKNKPALNEILAAWVRTREPEEAEALLQSFEVPAAKSRHFGEVVTDPRLRARRLFAEVPDGLTTALPWLDAATGWRGAASPPPALGQDNEYVFGELLGLKEEEIERLTQAKVIA